MIEALMLEVELTLSFQVLLIVPPGDEILQQL